MAKKRRNAAEAYGARHQRDEAKRNRAEHGEKRRNATEAYGARRQRDEVKRNRAEHGVEKEQQK